MNYTRVLRKGMSGDDVQYIKDCLFKLNYYDDDITEIKSDTYGNDTVNAVKKFQTDNKELSIDGIIGERTWNSIVKAINIPSFKRTLRRGMSGDDVLYVKQCLFELGYYSENVKKISNNSFGNDTVKAVEFYQSTNRDINNNLLKKDGIIGQKTWEAIMRDIVSTPSTEDSTPKKETELHKILSQYTWISQDKRDAIEIDLEKVSELRQTMCVQLLLCAYDKDVGGDVPRALYIFGANLYDTNLKLNYADKTEINDRASKRPAYFNGGRKEWMLEQVEKNPKLPASDCSGMIVGMMRKFKLIKSTADTTANGLCGSNYSTQIARKELKPGDFVGRDGHIGMFVGGHYVVEFYGGAFTCQLTDVDNRKGYNFIRKKVESGKAWTKFRRPKLF